MNSLFVSLKTTIKKYSTLLTKLFGITLLNKSQTEAYLNSRAEQLLHDKGKPMQLPEVLSSAADKKILFRHRTIDTASRYVWRLKNSHKQVTQLRNGSIILDGKALDLGFGNKVIAKDLFKITRRSPRPTKILIAPWTYYWTGYFDYIFFVALNLYRIKETMLPADFAEAILCYPLFNTGFEKEILTCLGFSPAQVVDSRKHAIQFESCIVSNNDSWFYPNQADVLAFKAYFESRLSIGNSPHKRIYIQRAGRRKILNEAALLALVGKYDFHIVEDIPRTFAEQVSLYHNASFIIGPHGASFANILWCQPGSQLVELFPNTYMPDYFRYLAQILQLNYAAYCLGQPVSSAHIHVDDDVAIDLAEVEQQLRALL